MFQIIVKILSFVAIFVCLLLISNTQFSKSNNILLVHDKGLPPYYISNKRDLRQQRVERNSFLYVIDLDEGRILRKYHSYYGINEGDKAYEDDMRTPVGKYEVILRRRKDCASRFGPYSILINYPNYFDQKRRSPGSAITIHGGPERKTAGCIRLLDHRHRSISYECRQTKRNAAHHVKAIWELHREGYDEVNTPLLSFSSLHRDYCGREGAILSPGAIRFYENLLSKTYLSNEEIDKLGAKKIDEPDSRPSPARVRTAHAKSSLGNFRNIHYSASNVLDGDPSTAWTEGVKDGPGIGEYIRVIFPDNQEIREISIINGYNKRTRSGDRWQQNNRVKQLEVEFSDGKSLLWDLKDTKDWQILKLKRPVTTRLVTMTIKGVYRGTRWNDTCISEIGFR